MKKEDFEKLDKLADKIHQKFEELDKIKAFDAIETEINKICASLPKNFSVSFQFALDVFDEEKEKELTVWKSGLCCFGQSKAYRLQGGGSTSHTYIVNGEVKKVPHDYCPSCWGIWDFKLKYTSCSLCGISMGNEIKLLLDTDTCPSCEEGKVSMQTPKCTKCGFEVDGKVVCWG